MGNIQNGQLNWSNLKFTSDEEEIEKYRLKLGDVLFNRTNSPELVGKTAVFSETRPAIYAGYLIRVRCGKDLLPEYLGICLNSPAGRLYSWRVKSDGVSQSNVNAKKLRAFPIPLPGRQEQAELVRRVRLLLATTERLHTMCQLGRLDIRRLEASALAKAFRGELVPQDPNDEPASVLLERLRAQRNGAKSSPKKAKPRRLHK